MTKVIFRGEIQNQANFGFSQVLFMTHAKKIPKNEQDMYLSFEFG